jgi:hypothetical protein
LGGGAKGECFMNANISISFTNNSPYFVVVANYQKVLSSHFEESAAIKQVESEGRKLISNGFASICYVGPGETITGELVGVIPRPLVHGPEEIEPFFKGAFEN